MFDDFPKDPRLGHGILTIIDKTYDELAEEVECVAQEAIEGSADASKNIWTEFRKQTSRGKRSGWPLYETRMQDFCRGIFKEHLDRFEQQVLARCTKRFPEFETTAGRDGRPSIWQEQDWVCKALYERVLRRAEEQGRSAPYRYDPELIDQLIACLRSLLPMTDDDDLRLTINGLKGFREGDWPNLFIRISCVSRTGYGPFDRESIASVGITDEGVALSTAEEFGSSDCSSSHPPFDRRGFQEWRSRFNEIRTQQGASVDISGLW